MVYNANFKAWSTCCIVFIGCIGGAGKKSFACKSQGCLWQDWYIFFEIPLQQYLHWAPISLIMSHCASSLQKCNMQTNESLWILVSSIWLDTTLYCGSFSFWAPETQIFILIVIEVHSCVLQFSTLNLQSPSLTICWPTYRLVHYCCKKKWSSLSKNLGWLWHAYIRSSYQFVMLQSISVDIGHIIQPELSLEWTDLHEIVKSAKDLGFVWCHKVLVRVIANYDLRMPCILYYFRYVVIVHPMKSRSLFTTSKMLKILLLVWFVAICLSAPSLHIMVSVIVQELEFNTTKFQFCRDNSPRMWVGPETHESPSFSL